MRQYKEFHHSAFVECLFEFAFHVSVCPTSPSSPAGLSIDGLYRVSGNLAVIQKLRFAVNHGKASIPLCYVRGWFRCLG